MKIISTMLAIICIASVSMAANRFYEGANDYAPQAIAYGKANNAQLSMFPGLTFVNNLSLNWPRYYGYRIVFTDKAGKSASAYIYKEGDGERVVTLRDGFSLIVAPSKDGCFLISKSKEYIRDFERIDKGFNPNELSWYAIYKEE